MVSQLCGGTNDSGATGAAGERLAQGAEAARRAGAGGTARLPRRTPAGNEASFCPIKSGQERLAPTRPGLVGAFPICLLRREDPANQAQPSVPALRRSPSSRVANGDRANFY